jgi:hypothetical protein
MTHPYRDDHATALAEDLLSWLRGQPKMLALTSAVGSQVQELEDSLLDLRQDRLIAGAIGEQLEQFGVLVGEPRGSLADEDYRRFIQARILSNLCEGTPDELMTILRIIAGPVATGTDVVYRRRSVASFSLEYERGAALPADAAVRVGLQMVSVSPAGVELDVVEGVTPAFRFDAGPGFDLGKLGKLIA